MRDLSDESGRILFFSEKHLRDIQGMFQISGDQLDLAYIDKKTKELNLYSYWKKLKKPNSF